MKKLIFKYDPETDTLNVDAVAACGATFERVARVLEPNSVNPGLMLPRALGVEAVRVILEGINLFKVLGENKFQMEY